MTQSISVFMLLSIAITFLEYANAFLLHPIIKVLSNKIGMRKASMNHLERTIPHTYSPLVDCILRAGLEKKANSISLVKLPEGSSVADYYVILEGNNRPQINAISLSVEVNDHVDFAK